MQPGTELTEREKFVLGTIVENFVAKASPIGSTYIAKKYHLPFSPATLRNVMMDLEEKGYLRQPHTSAGRMPTDKGYRFYVDSIMKVENISPLEKNRIYESLRRVSQDIEYILEAASHTLAQISNQLGVVLAPRFYQGRFDRMELVPISDNRILVIITIQSGLVKTITMELEHGISRDTLQETCRILNERLHGLTLKEIKRTIDERMRDVNLQDTRFIDLVLKSSRSLFTFPSPSDLHIGGTSNIMTQPEFADQTKLKNIMNLLDDKEILIQVFNRRTETEETEAPPAPISPHRIKITIGEENKEHLMRYCSLITATYHLGGVSGTIGLLGPTRMPYSKLVAVIDYMAEVLSSLFNAESVPKNE